MKRLVSLSDYTPQCPIRFFMRQNDVAPPPTRSHHPSMLAAIHSAAILGVDAYDVTVEVDAAPGLPQWLVVGMPLGAVKESRERVGAALANSGFKLPPRRITVNLAPADRPKSGTAFDLPIAVGILVATGQLAAETVQNCVFAGELGLDGSLRGIRGALSIARRASSCPALRHLVLPRENVAEASRVSRISLSAPADLATLVSQLARGSLSPPGSMRSDPIDLPDIPDFADVVGQDAAKRALEVAAAGSHNLLMIGPPGAGKTMLARRLPGILPELTEDEALEVIAVHSVAGTLTSAAVSGCVRPFRAPHHSISSAGLIGGSGTPRPGEVSLSHHGILFLDEMLEFPRSVLEGLRQPMEDGEVVISRAATSVRFPARFTLVGATNPCPCGKLGDPGKRCTCASREIERYSRRMSGPLADRIDMHVAVGAVPLGDLGSRVRGEATSAIRDRVAKARALQTSRFSRLRGVSCNAHASGRWIDVHGGMSDDARSLLQHAAASLAMSARGYHRAMKVARTIADIDGAELVGAGHVAEALRYRSHG